MKRRGTGKWLGVVGRRVHPSSPIRVVVALLLALTCLGGRARADDRLPPLERYAGSETCAECHREKYEGWRQSLHFSVVRHPEEDPEAILGDFSSPDAGITPDDVVFAIGGHWYQRYAVRVGSEVYVSPHVWSVASQRWETQDTWSWNKKPYDRYCVGCHSTRFDPADGTYVEHRVGCEACHGPGGDHARSDGKARILNPGALSRDDRDLLCASCHVRGFDSTGIYPFPVAYVPGEDLTQHYEPLRLTDGASSRETLLQEFRRWRDRLGDGPPPSCDVCGIQRDPPVEPAPVPTVTDQCLACHRFGPQYSEHTQHPGRLDLQCLDCHRGIRPTATLASSADVHSPEFFQVHGAIGDEGDDVKDACRTCHQKTLSSQRGSPPGDPGKAQHWILN